jgi:hypothetical protein
MKLLLAAPCNLALQDPEVGHSLIGVFHEIKIQIPLDAAEIPSNAMIPREWSIFSKFSLDPEEEGKDYTLKTDVFWPDGTILISHALDAKQPTKDGVAFIAKLQAFPMGQQGIVRINESLTSEGKVVFGPIKLEVKIEIERILPPTEEKL